MLRFRCLILFSLLLPTQSRAAELAPANNDKLPDPRATGILISAPREADRSETAAKNIDIRKLMQPPREEERAPEKKEKVEAFKPSAADRKGY